VSFLSPSYEVVYVKADPSLYLDLVGLPSHIGVHQHPPYLLTTDPIPMSRPQRIEP
jgi:hypothetical protein